MFPFGAIDPSKMDPQTIAALSDLMRQLPPASIQKMQTLMHNSMAGFDVRKEMEEFERNLPPDFREKLLAIVARGGLGQAPSASTSASPLPGNMREARLTILRAVASGELNPEEAERALWPEE